MLLGNKTIPSQLGDFWTLSICLSSAHHLQSEGNRDPQSLSNCHLKECVCLLFLGSLWCHRCNVQWYLPLKNVNPLSLTHCLCEDTSPSCICCGNSSLFVKHFYFAGQTILTEFSSDAISYSCCKLLGANTLLGLFCLSQQRALFGLPCVFPPSV